MTTPVWTAGTLKLPGDLVQPVTVPAPASAAIPNAGFESGDVGWTKGTGWAIGAVAGSFQGANCAQSTGGTHNTYLESTTDFAVTPGQSITLSCVTNGGNATGNGAAPVLAWYTAGLVLIEPRSEGPSTQHSEGAWESSSFTAAAPAGAAFVRPGARGNVTGAGNFASVDSLAWNYTVPATADGLIYKAVQPAAGTTDASEPAWPATLGLTVIDGGVIWEATQASRVEWTAEPVLLSGATEPVWPTGVGGVVVDGSVMWECVTRSITDENCPHSKFVKIIANKVYAGDDDIIRYSATANPLDWSTANDAGYLPYGLNPHGSSPVAALGEYRSNLVAFNAGGFQMWQVDENPANAALLDALPIGSTWHRSLFSVGDDLFVLTSPGVRTLGIAGGSTNLASGQDVGEPIDPLVLDAIRVAEANSSRTVSTYTPAQGQYWLAFADYPPPAPTISGDVPDGFVGDAVAGAYTAAGGVQPYGAITVTAGTFPPGLTLTADGSYTGSLTTAGSYAWTVGGVDADGTPFSVGDTAEVTVTFPTWLDTTPTVIATLPATHTVNNPPVVAEGDLLIYVQSSSDVDFAPPVGYMTTLAGPSGRRAYYRSADGSEGGTTVNFVNGSGGGRKGDYAVIRVQSGRWGAVYGRADYAAPANPPAFTPTGASAKFLWIAAFVGPVSGLTYPHPDHQSSVGLLVAVCGTGIEAATNDPPTWTNTGHAISIAVSPP